MLNTATPRLSSPTTVAVASTNLMGRFSSRSEDVPED
jgi:hypothetical protein